MLNLPIERADRKLAHDVTRCSQCAGPRTAPNSGLQPVETLVEGLALDPVEPAADSIPQLGQAIIWTRVRLEQQGDPAVVLRYARQVLQHRGQSERVIPGPGCENHRDTIGFELGVLVQSPGKDLGAVADELLDVFVLAHLRGEHLATDADEPGLLQELEMVLLDDVADLVGEHAGQLAFALQTPVEAPRHEDVAARRGERVEVVRFDDAEVPRKIGALALAREPPSHTIDVALQVRVLYQWRGAQDVTGCLATDGDVFLLREPAQRAQRAEVHPTGLILLQRFLQLLQRVGGARRATETEQHDGGERERPHRAASGADRYSTFRDTSLPSAANFRASSRVVVNDLTFLSSVSLYFAALRSSSLRPRMPVVATTWSVPARPVASPKTSPASPLRLRASPRRTLSIRTHPLPLALF